MVQVSRDFGRNVEGETSEGIRARSQVVFDCAKSSLLQCSQLLPTEIPSTRLASPGSPRMKHFVKLKFAHE